MPLRLLCVLVLALLAFGASAAPVPPAPALTVDTAGCWRVRAGSREGLLWLRPDGRLVGVLGLDGNCPLWWWGRWWVDRTGDLTLVTDEDGVLRDKVTLPPYPGGWFGANGWDHLPLAVEARRPLEYFPEAAK